MKHKDRIDKLLAELRALPLLSKVGVADVPDLVRVESWEQAMDPEAVERWGAAELEAANQLGDAVQVQAEDRYQEWNDIVDPLRPVLVKLVQEALSKGATPSRYRKAVGDTVSWDYMHALAEEAYSDLDVPTFFRDLVRTVYARGHLPCDWQGGEHPKGNLVIF